MPLNNIRGVRTPAHQQRMLNIIRGRLYINELIYAKGQRFYALRL